MGKVKVSDMTFGERLQYYATAKRVTVGTIHQLIDGDFKRFFVGKLRGRIVSRIGDGQYKFDTAEDAKLCAIGFREHSQKLIAETMQALSI